MSARDTIRDRLFQANNDGLYLSLLQKTLAIARRGVNATVYSVAEWHSHLWQDSSRTVPAAINAVVGAMDDLTGNGFHALQATTSKKPFLRGTPNGSSIITDGDFSGPGDWVLGTGWTITGGKLVATAAADSTFTYNSVAAPVIGKVYMVEYDLTVTGGGVAVALPGVFGITRSASGHFTEWLIPTTTGVLFFDAVGTFSGTIDNVVIKAADASDVTAPWFLSTDGVDDCMQTASMNLTSVNKLYNAHAVYGSNTATAIIVESSDSTDTNHGTFLATFNRISTGNIDCGFNGTLSRVGVVLSPLIFLNANKVISCQYDISQSTIAAEVIALVNGVVPTTATYGSGDNGGNFGNFAFNLFSRATTGFFLSGRYFGGNVTPRSTILTASEQKTVNTWLGSISGVSIP